MSIHSYARINVARLSVARLTVAAMKCRHTSLNNIGKQGRRDHKFTSRWLQVSCRQREQKKIGIVVFCAMHF